MKFNLSPNSKLWSNPVIPQFYAAFCNKTEYIVLLRYFRALRSKKRSGTTALMQRRCHMTIFNQKILG